MHTDAAHSRMEEPEKAVFKGRTGLEKDAMVQLDPLSLEFPLPISPFYVSRPRRIVSVG